MIQSRIVRLPVPLWVVFAERHPAAAGKGRPCGALKLQSTIPGSPSAVRPAEAGTAEDTRQ
jgi:hypothetical protein